jgi:hypothetical protein
MRHSLYDIYYSAQHDQWSLIIRTFWLHGVVGADLRPDNGHLSDCCPRLSRRLAQVAVYLKGYYLEERALVVR